MDSTFETQENIYDLAVIGAGPAGSHAAALAAWAGLKTILIDKKQHPRVKSCGGFISSRALSLLPPDLDSTNFRGEAVYKIGVKLGSEIKYHHAEKRLGLLVKREAFDLALAKYAEQKGVKQLFKHRLSNIYRDECPDLYLLQLKILNSDIELNIKTRFIIGADGAYSYTARLSGLRENYSGLKGRGQSIILDDGTQITDPGTLLFYPLPLIGGMGWSFHGSRWLNRGVGALAGWKKISNACHSLFNKHGDNPDHAYQKWVLPFRGPVMENAKYNTLLIGDAAGLVEPFSGEGLFNAFLSSLLAVKSIITANNKGIEAKAIYDKHFRNYFKNNFPHTILEAFTMHGKALRANKNLPGNFALLMQNKHGINKNLGYSSPLISVFDKVMDSR